ncbi:MAG TPA: DNA-binding response regulator [Bacteroidetes bacterium]|jgi:two-component system, OmpR family, alkaline phosphatase synthesis response regulator PhoP|nr:DNA-binding response regulator [Bacteroidota bacterium]
MVQKILIVDDESDIVELLKYNLEKEGYKCYSAENGAEAVLKAKDKKPDLILLDIMMPVMDGIEACRQIRLEESLKGVFIAFLTARAEEYSEIAGFEVGADDYITKPIKPRVLISRVKAILSRTKNEAKADTITVGDLEIDRNTFNVTLRGNKLVLPKKEFELLYLLASKPDKVYTRESILNKVWGMDVSVVDRTIDVHIRKIREKIGDDRIQTIKGVGYKFVV